MVENIVRSDPPDYDRLERMSIDYIESVRTVSRPFSILLFLMPVALMFIWILFIETLWLLVLSVSVYLVIVFLSIYTRYRVDKKYRELDCSLGYYLIHSDTSMYTIRIAALVFAILVFVLVETYRVFNQYEFFIIVNAFIVLSFILSIFSPRFWLYGKRSSPELPSEVTSMIERIRSETNMPDFTVHVIPENKMKVANAYCTGMIWNKVFVTDYLLENLSPQETASIVAHELGHVIHRHNLKTLVLTFTMLFASSALFFSYLYVSSPVLYTFLAEAGIFLFLLGVPAFIPAMRRRFEIQADMFSARFMNMDTTINALLKTNYLNLTPIQLSGGATHPPLPIRISRIKSSFQRKGPGMKI